jgi:ferredoxin
MMTLTCGVKNIFGILVGAAKPAWHMQAGFDRELFARALIDLYLVRPPDLTIVDAITAMEGDGPSSGDPRHTGLLLAGSNAIAADLIAAEIAGIPKKLLFVEREAAKQRLTGADRGSIEVAGVDPASLEIAPFRLPPLSDVQFGLPRFLKSILRNHLTTRPVQNMERCILCGACVKACPPQVISTVGRKLKFDYSRCIRCYCCRELCPEKALDVKQGAILKLFGGKKNNLPHG